MAAQPGNALTTSAHDENGCAVLIVVGEIDVYTAGVLREAIHRLVHRGRVRLILDLSGVTCCDSTGLGVLVGGYKRTKAPGGSVRLVGVSDQLLRTLTITGLTKVFPVHADVASAIEADSADAASSQVT
jgi:anti-sigma B factor antagonist